MKPSVFQQVDATLIETKRLAKSPRHWNAGLMNFDGRLWMAYRYHRPTVDSRCSIAIVEINPKTLQPKADSILLKFPKSVDLFHHEDPRLFMFKGQPYVSYSEMAGYRPGVNYNCVVKYSRLSYSKGVWSIAESWQPKYGQNYGRSKEKNWVFFERLGKLYCVYQGSPYHIILEIEGDKVVNEYQTHGLVWPWGTVRGGCPPIIAGNKFLHIFHSSLPTETPPHFVRYYAAAYTFDLDPPFTIRTITPRPFMAGSEEDEHRVDPRYTEGWKPYVVFPCGVVDTGKGLLVSLGVNDWACAIARITDFELVPVEALETERYFMTDNGSRHERMLMLNGNTTYEYLSWEVPAPGPGCSSGRGFMKARDARISEELSDLSHVREITATEYKRGVGRL